MYQKFRKLAVNEMIIKFATQAFFITGLRDRVFFSY